MTVCRYQEIHSSYMQFDVPFVLVAKWYELGLQIFYKRYNQSNKASRVQIIPGDSIKCHVAYSHITFMHKKKFHLDYPLSKSVPCTPKFPGKTG